MKFSFLSAMAARPGRARQGSQVASWAAWCLAGSVWVAAAAGGAEPFVLTTRPVVIPEVGTVNYSVLRAGARQFSLLPPLRWRASADDKVPAVSWTSPEYHTSLSMRLEDESGRTSPAPDAEEIRRTVLKDFPEAKIKASYPCFAAGAKGVTVDYDHVMNERFPMSGRAAFVPVAGGLVRFTLSAPAAEFSRRQTEFNQLLNSFTVETNSLPAPAPAPAAP